MSNLKDINRSIKDALTEMYQERAILDTRIIALEQSERATRPGDVAVRKPTDRVVKNRASDGASDRGSNRKLDMGVLVPQVEEALKNVNGNGKPRKDIERDTGIPSADMSHVLAHMVKNGSAKETTGKDRYTRYTLISQSMRLRAGEGEITK